MESTFEIAPPHSLNVLRGALVRVIGGGRGAWTTHKRIVPVMCAETYTIIFYCIGEGRGYNLRARGWVIGIGRTPPPPHYAMFALHRVDIYCYIYLSCRFSRCSFPTFNCLSCVKHLCRRMVSMFA